MCMCVCVSRGFLEGQKKASDPLELGFQAEQSYLFAAATGTLLSHVLSPANSISYPLLSHLLQSFGSPQYLGALRQH